MIKLPILLLVSWVSSHDIRTLPRPSGMGDLRMPHGHVDIFKKKKRKEKKEKKKKKRKKEKREKRKKQIKETNKHSLSLRSVSSFYFFFIFPETHGSCAWLHTGKYKIYIDIRRVFPHDGIHCRQFTLIH